MTAIEQEFLCRANHLPYLGLGLSVDIYSPDIFALWEELQDRQLHVSYLEIFQADSQALRILRRRLPDIPFSYHAEGLWVTQPDWETTYAAGERLTATVRDLDILDALWVNQECASKEIAGYTFGTYLPPLFTKPSAQVTAHHTWLTQKELDRQLGNQNGSALLALLEGPPLSYFGVGDLTYAEFFAEIAAQVPCGFVLDLGHVWTVYRYTGAWRQESLESFFETFLQQFPLERVIQIHIAGLAEHPQVSYVMGEELQRVPCWIDAHEAAIPQELMNLLTRVLQEPRLTHLKGIALEVDNKAIPLICEEFERVSQMLHTAGLKRCWGYRKSAEKADGQTFEIELCPEYQENQWILCNQYGDYVELVTGKKEEGCLPGKIEAFDTGPELSCYVNEYLPHEILCWGGDIQDLFPETYKILNDQGIPISQFVQFWFAQARPSHAVYDFFLLKIRMFVEFAHAISLKVGKTAESEAKVLSDGYMHACQCLEI